MRLLLSDVDGVWTDGRITVHADGSESTDFHVQDGYGMVLLRRAGIEVAVITGRHNPSVKARVEKLGITELRMGSFEKGPLVEELVRSRGLMHEEVAAIGDSRQPIRGNAGKTLVNQLLSEMDGVDSAIDRVLVLSFGSLRGQVV